MSLPPELLVSPPRSAAAAEVFLAKTKKKAIGLFFGGTAAAPTLVALFWLRFGDLNLTTILISIGISTLIQLMGFALLVNARKSAALFREGMAVLGTVRSVKSPGDGKLQIVEVAFLGGNGTIQVGQVAILGSGASVREGTPMPVLYSVADPRRFAIYTPALGMMTGNAPR